MRIRVFTVLIFLVLVTVDGLAQVELVPVSNPVYLFLKKMKTTIPKSMPIHPARKPHLKSDGCPVSPKKPQTNGAKNEPTFTPI